MTTITGLYKPLLPQVPSIERLADDALLMLSKLRDRLASENATTPACRVDEAMEITLAAAREALRIEEINHG